MQNPIFTSYLIIGHIFAFDKGLPFLYILLLKDVSPCPSVRMLVILVSHAQAVQDIETI